MKTTDRIVHCLLFDDPQRGDCRWDRAVWSMTYVMMQVLRVSTASALVVSRTTTTTDSAVTRLLQHASLLLARLHVVYGARLVMLSGVCRRLSSSVVCRRL